MEQRRFLLFMALSLAVLMGWTYVSSLLWPPPKQAPQQQAAANKDAGKPGDEQKPGQRADAAAQDQPEAKNATEKVEPADAAKGAAENPAAAPPEKDAPPAQAGAQPQQGPVQPAKFPPASVDIGSLDPDSGYFLRGTLTSKGGALATVELNDPRYQDLDLNGVQLRLLGSSHAEPRTFELEIAEINEQLKPFKTNLRKVDWELVETKREKDGTVSGATFRYPAPDGSIEIRKRFAVKQLTLPDTDRSEFRDTTADGYQIEFTLELRNLSEQKQNLSYLLQGPAGLPLENAHNTRKYRDVKLVSFDPDEAQVPLADRSGNAQTFTAGQIVKDINNQKPPVYLNPLRFIGIDVQYFTALVFPLEDQMAVPYIKESKPIIVGTVNENARDHTDISVVLQSVPLEIAPRQSVTHKYSLFAGPKRGDLLEPLGARSALDFGWFRWVSIPLLKLLKLLHTTGIPWGISIIIMTLLVRACMYPISLKQAKSVQKMKELQPKLAELKKKYEKEKDKLARAQMELFSKHNYNPLGGCLPMLLQFPIFIGLYQALSNAVDLRAAPFLWFDNLAAPDALFKLPFVVPYFLWTEFNLLPFVTVGLFLVQQMLLMPPPPPGDEQAAFQQKMMKFMTVFMGVLFYTVPSGLCVYFITSSLWSLGERKLLDFQKKGMASAAGGDTGGDAPATGESAKAPVSKSAPGEKRERGTGWWAKLAEAAERAARDAQTNGRSGRQADADKKKKKGSRR